jgi:four helix bundle protein
VSCSYRELVVWQKARKFAGLIYDATDGFPYGERFGLTSQLRRAAVSVASNIAEGQGRLTTGEFRQFLGQARGSLLEVETQMAIALDLGYLKKPQYDELDCAAYQVLGLLNRLVESLRHSPKVVALKP